MKTENTRPNKNSWRGIADSDMKRWGSFVTYDRDDTLAGNPQENKRHTHTQ